MKKLIVFIFFISSTLFCMNNNEKPIKKRKILNPEKQEEIKTVKKIINKSNFINYCFLVYDKNERLKNENERLRKDIDKLNGEIQHLERCEDCLLHHLNKINK